MSTLALPTEVTAILGAAVTFIIMSFLYKENDIYSIVEGIAVGFSVANSLMLLIQDVINRDILPLAAGNVGQAVPLIFGALMFTFFITKLKGVYRAVLMSYVLITYGVSFGVGLQSTLVRFVTWGQAAANNLGSTTSIGGWVSIIVITCALFYLSYSQKLQPVYKYPGMLGYFFFISMFGWIMGYWQTAQTVALVGVFTSIESTMLGTAVMVIAFAVFIVDALVGWKKILGLKPKNLVEASSTRSS
jgi:hypothetical protein